MCILMFLTIMCSLAVIIIYSLIYSLADAIFYEENYPFKINEFLWKKLPFRKNSPYYNFIFHKLILFLFPFLYLPYRFFRKVWIILSYFKKSNIENIVNRNLGD